VGAKAEGKRRTPKEADPVTGDLKKYGKWRVLTLFRDHPAVARVLGLMDARAVLLHFAARADAGEPLLIPGLTADWLREAADNARRLIMEALAAIRIDGEDSL
jgi:hypothetical protein